MNEKKSSEWVQKNNITNRSKLYQTGHNLIINKIYTTIGRRLNYIFSCFLLIFLIWIQHIRKIRKYDESIQQILKVIYLDLKEYIYNMYWKYIIISNNKKAFLKLGNDFKTIIKYSIIIFMPLLLYIGMINIIFIVNIPILLILWLWKIIIIKIFNLKKKKDKNKIWKIIYKLNITLLLLLKNLQTNNSIRTNLYLKIYKICGIIQKNIYMSKGAFYVNNLKKNKIIGIKNILNYFILKYKVFLENKKKKIKNIQIKSIIENKKKEWKKKKILIEIIWNINFRKIKNNMKYKIMKINYRINKKIFHMNKREFIKINNIKNIIHIKKTYKLNWKNINKIIISFFYNYLKKIMWSLKYKLVIKLTKKSIQKEKKKTKLQKKIENILLNKELSNWCREQRYNVTWIELFFLYRAGKVKENILTYELARIRNERYWKVYIFKYTILAKLTRFFVRIEKTYKSFLTEKYSKNWGLWKKIKFLFKVYGYTKHIRTRSIFVINEIKVSRDFFFYKKAKDRKKLRRHYFYKGIINWIYYKLFKKIKYENIKNLKSQKIKIKKGKFKYINYKLSNISPEVHMGRYLFIADPELWALTILYQLYYNLIFKYYFNIEETIEWHKYLPYTKDFKWRIGSHNSSIKLSTWTKAALQGDIIRDPTLQALKNINTKPRDIFFRWVLIILENNIFAEDYLMSKNNKKQLSWHDLSVTHLLTYDMETDSLKFEIKEFLEREKEKSSIFDMFMKSRSETFREYRYYDMDKQGANITKLINEKNKKIKDNILKERHRRSKELLVRAIRFNEITTQLEYDKQREFEKSMDFFFKKRVELFDEMSEFEIQDYAEFVTPHDEYEWFNFTDLKFFRDEYWLYNGELNSAKRALNKEQELKKGLNDQSNKTRGEISAEKFLNHWQKHIDLLDSHFAVISFDATISEILEFLNMELINLKGGKNIELINYIQINLGKPSILPYINKNQVAEEIKNHFFEDTLDAEKNDGFYSRFLKFESDVTREEALNDVLEDNKILYRWNIGGVLGVHASYTERTKHLSEAVKFQQTNVKKYYGSEILLWWVEVIEKRSRTLKNIKRKSSKNKIIYECQYYYPLLFINNIRWNLDQWLGYGDTKNEEKIIKLHNLLILEERYDLWKIKRFPLRLQAPIYLTMKKNRNFLKKLKKNFKKQNTQFVLFGSIMGRIIKASVVWDHWRKKQEKELNRSIEDILFWVLNPEPWDKEARLFKEKNKHVLPENFLKIYAVYSGAILNTLLALGWDFIRYYKRWMWMENEIPMIDIWVGKLTEVMRSDNDIKKELDDAEDPCLLYYSPLNYHTLFNNTRGVLNYIICKLAFYGFIWNYIDIIFYNPGEFLYNPVLVVINLPIIIMCKIWERRIKANWKDMRDIIEGQELYLYKFQSTEIKTAESEEKRLFEEKVDRESREFMNTWKDQFTKDFNFEAMDEPTKEKINAEKKNQFLQKSIEGKEWWRSHSYAKSEKNFGNKFVNDVWVTKKSQFGFIVLMSIFLSGKWWKNQKFLFREADWLWDYYLPKQKRKYSFILNTPDSKKTYSTRTWHGDNFKRFNSGGNQFSKWYINVYRKYQGKNLQGLDCVPLGKRWEYFRIPIQDPLNKQNRAVFDLARWDAEWAIFSKKLLVGQNIVAKKIKRKYSLQKIMQKKGGIRDKYWKDLEYENRRFSYFHNLKEDHITQYKYTSKEFAYVRWRSEIRSRAIEYFYGERWLKIRHNSPYETYLKYLRKLKKRWDFDPAQTNPTHFIWRLKNVMTKTIKKDKLQYFSGDDYLKKKAQSLIIKKKNSFKTGEPLDLEALLSMTEMEKHKYVLYYNFAKCKVHRLEMYLKARREEKEILDKGKAALDKMWEEEGPNYLPSGYSTLFRTLYDLITTWDPAATYHAYEQKMLKRQSKIMKFIKVWDKWGKDLQVTKEYVRKSKKFIENNLKTIPDEERIKHKSELLSELWLKKKNWNLNTLIDIKNIFMPNKDITLYSIEQFVDILEILWKFLKNLI